MTNRGWTVVKVGGSLFDLPDLRSRLQEFLGNLGAGSVLIVPGGGATAEAIRALDNTHQLGEEASHWLAVEALSINARFLQTLLPEAKLIRECTASGDSPGAKYLLDAWPFFQADKTRYDHLPHCWVVTSDSLALRAATLFQARELILLKSVDWPGDDWVEAGRLGVVDGYFAEALQQAPTLRVRIVNLRLATARVAAP